MEIMPGMRIEIPSARIDLLIERTHVSVRDRLHMKACSGISDEVAHILRRGRRPMGQDSALLRLEETPWDSVHSS